MLLRWRQWIASVPGARRAVRAWRRHSASFRRPVVFWDGQTRSAGGHIARMLRDWRADPGQALESDVVFRAYRGGDVIDVGAYEGWYAILLAPRAKPGDRFMLLEPDPRALPALHEVAADLSRIFPHVHFAVLPVAAGTGDAAAVTFPYGDEGHPRVIAGAGGGPRTLRLDDMVALFGLAPTLVKIDVEGAEWEVLQGSRELLRRSGADLMLEIHPRWLPAGVDADFLRTHLQGLGFASQEIDVSGNTAHRELWTSRGAAAAP